MTSWVADARVRNFYGVADGRALIAVRRDTRSGRVRQLPGAAGCLSLLQLATCTPVRGLESMAGAAVSVDGRNVYVVGQSGDATAASIAVLTRDALTGALSQPPGPAGCVAAQAIQGCALAPALTTYPFDIAISPDDATVVVAGAHQVALFARDKATGGLGRGPGAACGNEDGSGGCETALGAPRGIDETSGFISFSPDARSAYVTYAGFANNFEEQGHDVVTFLRAADGGFHAQLTAIPCPPRCPLTPGRLLAATPLVVPSLRAAYITTEDYRGKCALDAVRRNAGSGILSAPRRRGTAFDVTCAPNDGSLPSRTTTPALSPDGRHLYVAGGGRSLGRVAAFSRLRKPPRLAPVSTCAASRGCGVVRARGRLSEATISADGQRLYVYSYRRSLSALIRHHDGSVSQPRGRAGCASEQQASCARAWIPGISHGAYVGDSTVPSVKVSPDNRYVYVLASGVTALRAR